jgi:NADH-quinone oxidoreductase subunit L
MMMLVVTFVSLMVHIYTIGYMSEDPGINVSSVTSRSSRFRCSCWSCRTTFSVVLWLGGGGLGFLFVDRLLVHETDGDFCQHEGIFVNRVGDFGFLLGIGLIAAFAGTLNYAEVFDKAVELWLL